MAGNSQGPGSRKEASGRHLRPGIATKLARGFDHLDELEARVQAFGAGRPIAIELEEPEPDGFRLARLRVVAAPPVILGVIAGEAIHQFRSSLDHMMSELVWLDHPDHGETPLFPIHTTKSGFDDYVKSARLRHLIRPAHLDAIRELQPYHDLADRPEMLGGYLNAIRAFNNDDKHRVVHAATVAPSRGIQSTRPRLTHPAIDAFDWRVTSGPLRSAALDGAPYFRVRFKPGHEPLAFDLDPLPTIVFIDASRREWSVGLMRSFGTRVAESIARFHETM